MEVNCARSIDHVSNCREALRPRHSKKSRGPTQKAINQPDQMIEPRYRGNGLASRIPANLKMPLAALPAYAFTPRFIARVDLKKSNCKAASLTGRRWSPYISITCGQAQIMSTRDHVHAITRCIVRSFGHLTSVLVKRVVARQHVLRVVSHEEAIRPPHFGAH